MPDAPSYLEAGQPKLPILPMTSSSRRSVSGQSSDRGRLAANGSYLCIAIVNSSTCNEKQQLPISNVRSTMPAQRSYHGCHWRVGSTAPSPTTTNGAQTDGCADHGRLVSSISDRMARRKPSDLPIALSRRICANVSLVNTVAA